MGKGVLWDQGGRENKIHSPFSLAFLPLPPHWRRRNVPFSVSLSLSLFPLFFLFSFHVEKRKEEGRRRPPPQLQHTKHYATTHITVSPPHTFVVQFLRDVNVCTLRGRRGGDPRCQLMKSGLHLPSFGGGGPLGVPSPPPSSFSPVKPLFKRSVYTYQTWETLDFFFAKAML